MGRFPRRVLVTVLVASMLVVAGCLGGGGSTDGDDSPETSATTGTTDGTDPGGNGPGGTTTAAPPPNTATPTTSPPPTTPPSTTTPPTTTTPPSTTTPRPGSGDVPEYTEGSTYTYEVAGDANYTVEWHVVSVEGNQVVAEVSSDQNGQRQSQRVNGTHRSVANLDAFGTPGGFTISVMRSVRMATVNHSLTAGNTWTNDSQGDTVEFEVIGSDSYAGIPCTVVRASEVGTDAYAEVCVNKDYPLGLYYVGYNAQGELAFEMTLVDYSS